MNMSTHEFNTDLLTAWVALCDKLGEMRSAGASAEEIAVVEELIKCALAVLVNTSNVRGVVQPEPEPMAEDPA
jgi:hypothetical protein